MNKRFRIDAVLAFVVLMLCTPAFAQGMIVKEGAQAPGFTLESSQGGSVSLKDFRGKKVVLWFYPKDDTPG